MIAFNFPNDNFLPIVTAKGLYGGLDLRTQFPGWQSSDRPPLQGGIVAAQFPAVALISAEFGYQILACLLQALAFAALFALLEAWQVEADVSRVVFPR